MRTIMQYERISRWDPHIIVGHFNKREEKELILNGYRKTWEEKYKPKQITNKNGIPLQRMID